MVCVLSSEPFLWAWIVTGLWHQQLRTLASASVHLPKDFQLQLPPTPPPPLLPGKAPPLCGSSDVLPLTAAPSGNALGRPCSTMSTSSDALWHDVHGSHAHGCETD